MKRIISYIIIILSFFGCNNSPEKETTRKILEFSNIETSNIQDIFDFNNSKFIQIANDSNLRLSNEIKIRVLEDDIFILDYSLNKLFRFNKDGRLKNEIGQRGKGPKEYLAPCDFYIDQSKQIVEILGEPFSTVTKYTYDGQFVNTINFKFPSQSFIKGKNETYFFYRGVNSASEPYRLTVTDTSKILSTHLKDQGNPGIGHIMEKDAFSSNNESIFLMESLLPTIYDVSNSEISEELTLNYGPKTINEETTSQYSSVGDFFQKITTNGFYCIRDIASTDKQLILKTFYQEKDKEMIFHYLFYGLNPDYSPKRIHFNENDKHFLAYSYMYECFKNYLVFSVSPFDIINSDISDSFPSHFFDNIELKESDNPIILLMKLKS